MPGGAVPTQPAPVPFVQPSRPSPVSQTAPVSLASQTGAYQQPVQPQPIAAPSAGIPTPLAAPGQSGQPAYADPSSPTVPPTGGKRRNTRKIVVVTVIVLLAVVIAVCAGLWIWSTSAASGSARKSAERYLQMIETGDYSGANAFAKRDGHGSDNVDELPATDKKIMQDVESITDYGIDGRPESAHPWPTEYLVKVHYSVDGIRRDRTLRVTASNNPIEGAPASTPDAVRSDGGGRRDRIAGRDERHGAGLACGVARGVRFGMGRGREMVACRH